MVESKKELQQIPTVNLAEFVMGRWSEFGSKVAVVCYLGFLFIDVHYMLRLF